MSEPGVQGGQQLAPRNSLPILLASDNQRLPADGPWHCIYKGLYLSITHFWPLPSQDINSVRPSQHAGFALQLIQTESFPAYHNYFYQLARSLTVSGSRSVASSAWCSSSTVSWQTSTGFWWRVSTCTPSW